MVIPPIQQEVLDFLALSGGTGTVNGAARFTKRDSGSCLIALKRLRMRKLVYQDFGPTRTAFWKITVRGWEHV